MPLSDRFSHDGLRHWHEAAAAKGLANAPARRVAPLVAVEDEEWAFIADRLSGWLTARDRASDPLTWDMVEVLRDDIRQALDRVGFVGVV